MKKDAKGKNTAGGGADAEPLVPFATDGEAWGAGLGLLNRLYRLRGNFWRAPDNVKAEKLILQYVRRLRASDAARVTLASIQRLARLDGERLVVVLYALASHYGILSGRIRDAGLAAVGFDPERLRRLGTWITSNSRLVGWGAYAGLYPTRELLDWASRAWPISEREAEAMRKRVRALPTARGRGCEEAGLPPGEAEEEVDPELGLGVEPGDDGDKGLDMDGIEPPR